MPKERKVLFVQPGVPTYRTPFYEALRSQLETQDVTLDIVRGSPTRELRGRGAQSDLSYIRPVTTLRLPLGRATLSIKPAALRQDADLFILEHGSSVMENYALLAGKKRVALWGHGGAFVSNGARIDDALERWQLRRCTHYFAYTAEGGRNVISQGLDSAKLTVVNNSVDTRSIVEARSRAEKDGRQPFSPTALFVGGLDESKRIAFLIDAVERIAATVPGFTLVMAGTGPLIPLVQGAIERGVPIELIGNVGAEELGVLSTRAQMILMPGRVGLVSVDSFALGLPIVTTRRNDHAPEFGYLSDGVDSLITDDDVMSYSSTVATLLADHDRLAEMRSNCLAQSASYSIEAMATAFATGIDRSLLGTGK